MNGIVQAARSYRVHASRVFDAWLDPASAGRWLFATATRPMTDVQIDARVAGRFLFACRRDGDCVVCAGEYVALARPSRLAFALFAGEGADAPTLVSVDITPRGSGCRLKVSHERLPASAIAAWKTRWMGMLYGLGVTLAETRHNTCAAPANRVAEYEGENSCITC